MTKTTATKHSSARSGPRPRVLIVDDEPAIRRLWSMILRKGGYNTLVAEDGLEALDIYARERERISLVLLDGRMPKLDGTQTLGGLRAINPGVVVVSTGSCAEFEYRCGEECPNAIMPKPVAMDTLLSVLAEHLPAIDWPKRDVPLSRLRHWRT